MQRIYWLLALVVLLGGAYFFLLPSSQSAAKGSHLVADRDFKIEDAEQIQRIFIADRSGQQVELSRQGKNWLVDGKHLANENAINNLLDAVKRIDMQHIPAKAAVPNIIKNLATEGILVQIFDKNNQKLKGYYIGGSTSDERGTYAIMEGADQPYVVHLPAWVGNLRFRLNFFGDDWRSKQIFAEEINSIEKISVEYPTQRNRSFILSRKGENYTVAPVFDSDQPTRDVPRDRAERYLFNYQNLFVSSYENKSPEEKAELLKNLPFAHIQITKIDGTQKSLKAYPRYADKQMNIDNKTGEINTDRPLQGYNLLLNEDEDFAVIQAETLLPFLLSYQAF